MATMTVRLDDLQEDEIEQLQAHYGISTKNKAIIKVIDTHLNLIDQLNEEKAQKKKLQYILENIKLSHRRKTEAEAEWLKLMQDL